MYEFQLALSLWWCRSKTWEVLLYCYRSDTLGPHPPVELGERKAPYPPPGLSLCKQGTNQQLMQGRGRISPQIIDYHLCKLGRPFVASALTCRFIHSFYRYLLNASCVPGSVLGTGDIIVSITEKKKKSLLSKYSKF